MSKYTKKNALTLVNAHLAVNAKYAQVDALVGNYGLARNVMLLESICQYLEIDGYYNYVVQHANAHGEFYLDTARDPANWFVNAMNAYEGCQWEEVSKENARIIVLACLFQHIDRLAFRFAEASQFCTALAVPGAADQAMKSPTKVLSLIRDMSRGYQVKGASQLVKIARDALMMAPYSEDRHVASRYAGEYLDIQQERRLYGNHLMKPAYFIEEWLRTYGGYKWATKWGSKKAFFANYPAHLQRGRDTLLRTLPVSQEDNHDRKEQRGAAEAPKRQSKTSAINRNATPLYV